jgi:hypothetical protein
LEKPKEDYCNMRQANLGPTTQTKQSLPTTCESMDDWIAIETKKCGIVEEDDV